MMKIMVFLFAETRGAIISILLSKLPKDIKMTKLSEVTMSRCYWADTNELFVPYHDKEWGVPTHDDRLLFEMLNLEGAQAGLSWLIVLKKRDRYREVFDNFEATKIVHYDQAKRDELLVDAGIVRNRLKVNAVIENAKTYLDIIENGSSFDEYIWSFVDGKPLQHKDAAKAVVISQQMSKALLKRGFKFVGPTICYAFMQAVGMINDHENYCFRAKEVSRLN